MRMPLSCLQDSSPILVAACVLQATFSRSRPACPSALRVDSRSVAVLSQQAAAQLFVVVPLHCAKLASHSTCKASCASLASHSST